MAVLCTPGPHVILCQTSVYRAHVALWFGSSWVLQNFPDKGYVGGDLFFRLAYWFDQDTDFYIGNYFPQDFEGTTSIFLNYYYLTLADEKSYFIHWIQPIFLSGNVYALSSVVLGF